MNEEIARARHRLETGVSTASRGIADFLEFFGPQLERDLLALKDDDYIYDFGAHHARFVFEALAQYRGHFWAVDQKQTEQAVSTQAALSADQAERFRYVRTWLENLDSAQMPPATLAVEFYGPTTFGLDVAATLNRILSTLKQDGRFYLAPSLATRVNDLSLEAWIQSFHGQGVNVVTAGTAGGLCLNRVNSDFQFPKTQLIDFVDGRQPQRVFRS